MSLIIEILLTITGVDTNGMLFSLAQTVVNAENDNNWLWFLQLLLTIVQNLTLKSLIEKTPMLLSNH